MRVKKDLFKKILEIGSFGWKVDVCPIYFSEDYVFGGTVQPPWTSFFQVPITDLVKDGEIYQGPLYVSKGIKDALGILRGDHVILEVEEPNIEVRSGSFRIKLPLYAVKPMYDAVKDPAEGGLKLASKFREVIRIPVDIDFVRALRVDLSFTVEMSGTIKLKLECPLNTFNAEYDTGVPVPPEAEGLKGIFPSDVKRYASMVWDKDPRMSVSILNSRIVLILHRGDIMDPSVMGFVALGG